MHNRVSLQDQFLTQAAQGRLNVVIFLINGYQLRGVITGFDPFVVVLLTEEKQQVIYKHAISTVVPERPVELTAGPAPER